jgi:outer membrane protein, heavy metal efflux system
MKKVIFVCLCALLVCSSTTAQSLDDLFVSALEQNPGLLAKYKAFEIALEQVDQTGVLPDPTFSAGYFISPVETRVGPQRAKFSLSQMFPWFGTLKAEKNVSALRADARYQEFIEARNLIYFNLSSAYYPLLELNDQIEFEKSNIEILETYKAIATIKYENGQTSLTDILRIELMLNESSTTIQILEKEKYPLKSMLGSMVNLPAEQIQVGPDSLVWEPIAVGYKKDSLLIDNPVLTKLELNEATSKAQESIILKRGLPKVGVALDYMVVGERTDMELPDNGKDAIMPMISLSIPLNRKPYKSAFREAELQQERIALERLDFTNTLTTNYEMSWFEIEKQQELIRLYEDQLRDNEQILRLLMSEYSNSGEEFEEVLRVQRKVIDIKKKRSNAIAKGKIALAKIDYLTAGNR